MGHKGKLFTALSVSLAAGLLLILAQVAQAHIIYPYTINEFAIYGSRDVNLGTGNTIAGNLSIGAGRDVNLYDSNKWLAPISGGIVAGNDANLNNDNTTGDIVYGNTYTLGTGNTYNSLNSLPGALSSVVLPSPESLLGPYGSGNVASGSTYTLSSGTYYFDDFTVGSNVTLYLDAAGGLRIFSVGNMTFGTNVQMVLASGSASDVYFETHGIWAFGSSGTFLGTVFASDPNGEIDFGDENSLTGYLWSAGDVNLGNNNNVVALVPEPGTLLLLGSGLAGLGGIAWRRRRKS